MASYNAERKSGAVSFAGTPSTFSFSPATNCGSGNTLILAICYQNATNLTVSSVTDTPGNTWTVDVERSQSGGRNVHLCSTKQNVAALVTSDTVTVTMNATGTSTGQIWLEEFTGQYSFDVGASQNTGTGTSVTFGTTATTASTDEFAVVLALVNKSGGGASWTWTKDANYNNFTTAPPLPTGSQTLSCGAGYRLLSSTGTQSATYTTNNSTNAQVGIISTYKADTAAAAVVIRNPWPALQAVTRSNVY